MMDLIGDHYEEELKVEDDDEDDFIPDVESLKKFRKRYRNTSTTIESTNVTNGAKQ